VVLWMMGKAP
ncbi:elongation factor Tu GTP binding domain protein, partial [Vibrio parahaemolyticus V-223/04]